MDRPAAAFPIVNQETVIFSTNAVIIARFHHPPEERHVDPRIEAAQVTSVNLMEHGSFSLCTGTGEWELLSGQCFITSPGLVYRSRHNEKCPSDVLLSLQFNEEIAEETYSAVGNVTKQPVVFCSNRTRYLRRRLGRALEGDFFGATEVELIAQAILAESLAVEGKRRRYSQRQIDWYTERIEGARHLINQSHGNPITLQELARTAGMSKFHFAHIFSELVGTSPYQYLLAVRLRSAAQRLLDGASVTSACYDSGFGQLSQFTRLFQSRFRCPPSRFREALGKTKFSYQKLNALLRPPLSYRALTGQAIELGERNKL